MLERKEIVLPKPDLCPELIEELEAFEFSVTEAGNVRTGSPSGMHDDCVIALALAAWGRAQSGGRATGRASDFIDLPGRFEHLELARCLARRSRAQVSHAGRRPDVALELCGLARRDRLPSFPAHVSVPL
jgi:hypothetical protein